MPLYPRVSTPIFGVQLLQLLLLLIGYEAVTAVGRPSVKNTIAFNAPVWFNPTSCW